MKIAALAMCAVLLGGCISYRPITVDASDHFYIMGNTVCVAAQLTLDSGE